MRQAFGFAARVAVLVVLWLLAWGEVSPMRVVAGMVLAVAILLAFPGRSDDGEHLRISPVGMVKLIAYVAWQLVVSSVLVAREIVTPGSKVRTGVLAHSLDGVPEPAMSFIANVIALTPGTMTVEVTREPKVIYVHFLLLDDVDKARASIARMQGLVTCALYRSGEESV